MGKEKPISDFSTLSLVTLFVVSQRRGHMCLSTEFVVGQIISRLRRAPLSDSYGSQDISSLS
jgi:hypothetical protein